VPASASAAAMGGAREGMTTGGGEPSRHPATAAIPWPTPPREGRGKGGGWGGGGHEGGGRKRERGGGRLGEGWNESEGWR